jgi:hypothetical protein
MMLSATLVSVWHLAFQIGSEGGDVSVDPSWLTDRGAIGILAFAVLSFITGWLVTPGRFKDMKEDRDAWRMAFEKEHEARLKSDAVSEGFLKQGDVTVKLLNEIRENQRLSRSISQTTKEA